MRMMIESTANFERGYVETHIASVVKIGLDYGFDIQVDRYSSLTAVSLRQHYKESPRVIDSVEIIMYHDDSRVVVERVVWLRGPVKSRRIDRAEYADYNQEALEHIMRIVWDIETE